MDGSKTCYSGEEMELVLKAAEDLQDENDSLQSRIGEMERTHSSETQKLMSQISSMMSTIADLGLQLREKDAEIVNLNETIGKYSGSDLILRENEKLKEQIAEVTKWSAEETERAERQLGLAQEIEERAGKRNAEAEEKIRDFKWHLRNEGIKIRAEENAKSVKQYQRKLEAHKAKLGLWTMVIAVVHFSQVLAIIISYDLLWQDVASWLAGIGKVVAGIITENGRALDLWSDELFRLIGSEIMATLIAMILLAMLDSVMIILAINGLHHAHDHWRQMWKRYENMKEKDVRLAVTVGIVAVAMSIAMVFRYLLPPPLDFNLMTWWIIFSVMLNFWYHGHLDTVNG